MTNDEIMEAAEANVLWQTMRYIPVLRGTRNFIVPNFIKGVRGSVKRLKRWPITSVKEPLRSALVLHVTWRDKIFEDGKILSWQEACKRALPHHNSSLQYADTWDKFLNAFGELPDDLSGFSAKETYTSFDFYTLRLGYSLFFDHYKPENPEKLKNRARALVQDKYQKAFPDHSRPNTIAEFLEPFAAFTGFKVDLSLLRPMLDNIGVTPVRYGLFYDENDEKTFAEVTDWIRQHGTQGMKFDNVNWSILAPADMNPGSFKRRMHTLLGDYIDKYFEHALHGAPESHIPVRGISMRPGVVPEAKFAGLGEIIAQEMRGTGNLSHSSILPTRHTTEAPLRKRKGLIGASMQGNSVPRPDRPRGRRRDPDPDKGHK